MDESERARERERETKFEEKDNEWEEKKRNLWRIAIEYTRLLTI